MKKLFAFMFLFIPLAAFAGEVKISDGHGHSALVGIFGEVLSGQMVSDVQLSFSNELNTDYDVNTALTGDGAAALVGQTAQASSTTGTARIESKGKIRYRAGHTGIIRFTFSCTGSGTCYGGGFDSDAGFFLKVANGVDSFCYRNSSGDVCDPILQENEDGFRTSTIDYSKLNIFEIKYGYLGVANPELSVYADSGIYRISEIHTQNRLTDAHSGAPVFPIAIETSGAATAKSASWQGGTLGHLFESGFGRPFQGNFTGTLAAAGALDTLVNFKNSTTRSDALTATDARLLTFRFFVDTPSGTNTGTVEFKIWKNATLSGAGSYTAVSDGNSIMEYDTSVDYSSGGTTRLVDWVLWTGSNKGGSTGGDVEDAEKIGLIASPGDVFTITAQNVGIGTDTVTWRLAFNWEEF